MQNHYRSVQCGPESYQFGAALLIFLPVALLRNAIHSNEKQSTSIKSFKHLQHERH